MPSANQVGQAETPCPIVRQQSPLNVEFPLDAAASFITPNAAFYIRNHFAAPRLDAVNYRLYVHGAVERRCWLSLDDLRHLPAESVMATLECAGNGRVFLAPPAEGVQWQLGAIGTALWKGAPLRNILEAAGVLSDAREVVLEGADYGEVKTEPKPSQAISYARSIPLAKALTQETLIVYEMNGEDLSMDHGYPVRAVVPGHYGMASVKWLTGIRVVCESFRGYFQTTEYASWQQSDSHFIRRPLAEMMMKSVITRPAIHEVIPADQTFTISGIAWSGDSDVAAIEVSTDGGETWAAGYFLDPPQRFAWRRWQWHWQTPARVSHAVLMSRAKDAAGLVQPDKHDDNFGSYVIRHTLPIEVFIA